MKVVTFGEIMLRLAPPGHLRFSQASSFDVIYGGGESNVAVALANYGLDAHFVTRLPDNDIGECALMELRKRNVNTDHVIRGGERLGIYFLEMGAVQRGSKVVYDRAHSGMASIEKGMVDWDEVLKDADWFHWTGITPALSQGAADACLEAIQAANRLGVPVSTDLNYRAKLWKYGKDPKDVMPALVEGCDVILGNEEDAEKHFGLHPEHVDVTAGGEMDGKAYLPVLKELMNRFPPLPHDHHDPARLRQRQSQQLVGRHLRRRKALRDHHLPDHRHRRSRRWRRQLHVCPHLRPSHLQRRHPASPRLCRRCQLPQAHHIR